MNYIDYTILAVIAFFAIRGLFRGLLNEVFGLVGILLSVLLATKMMSDAANWLDQFVDIPPALSTILGFILVFAAVQLAIQFLNHVLQKIVKLTFLSAIDKLAGGLFGLLKGAMIISLLTMLVALLPMSENLIPGQTRSKLLEPLRGFAPSVFNLLAEIVPNSKTFYGEVKESFGNLSSSDVAKRSEDFLQSLRGKNDERAPSEEK